MADMASAAESYSKAKNLTQAKKYGWALRKYKFNEDGNIVEANSDDTSDVYFKYDDSGHPVEIISKEEGYRGSPSFKAKYSIAWNGDTPSSIKRNILEFESDYIDRSELEFQTDFSWNTAKYVKDLVKASSSTPGGSGNSCKLRDSETDLPVWCEVIYYENN